MRIYIWFGQTFLQIPDTSSLVADIEVREVDVANIKEKMRVHVEVDAFPGKVFSGEVEQISAVAYYSKNHLGERKFKARVRLLGDTGRIYTGMSITARVLHRKVNNVIAIPDDGLVYYDGSFWVNKMNSGEIEQVSVQVGIQGEHLVEITEGLRGGDVVILAGLPSAAE